MAHRPDPRPLALPTPRRRALQTLAAGGLNVKGTKRPIELISSDDQSNTKPVCAPTKR
jgi:hypothetical protein